MLKPIYSISRFLFSLQNKFISEPIVSVAGRVGRRGNHLCIYDAQGEVRFPLDNQDAISIGDFAVIQFEVQKLNSKEDSINKKALYLDHLLKIESIYKPILAPPDFHSIDGSTWFSFLQKVRSHFEQLGLTEVVTPYLVKNPGMEPELEPFSTVWKPSAKNSETRFLPTSPELHMKQLIVRGHTDIFEIRTVFRNEELTEQHRPEFKMIEWYRAYDDLTLIVSDLQSLLESLTGESMQLRKCTVAQLFQSELDFELKPSTTLRELYNLAVEKNLKPQDNWDWNDLFHYIWVSAIESGLPKDPFLLTDYPPSQAALARINPAGWASRIELYWRGYEIANGFYELNDPVEQRERFLRDQKKRVEYGRTPLEIDENFMCALQMGLPPCAGMAMGLERLFMALNDLSSIKQVNVNYQSY